MRQGDTYWHWSQLIPLLDEDGFALTLRDSENDDYEDEGGKLYRIERRDLEIGMKVFAEKYTNHFADFISENDDADTGDAFLQCVVFGEIVYG